MKITLKVQPNSSKTEIIEESPNNYKVYLKKPAHEGKANNELIKLLKKHFNKKAKIVKGHTSKTKIVELN
jgi:uncharacterized protein (TIGR00251 family)